MIDRFKMAHKFRSLIGIWLILIGSHLSGHLAQTSNSTSISDPAATTAAYLDDSQLINTIGNDECGCLANYEIKFSSDQMYTGQLIRCTNVRQFNHLSLINRLSAVARCSQLEQQFNEIIITNNKFQRFNYTLLQNLNFTIKADLSHNEIEQIDKSSFSGLTSLKHLDLSGNHLKQLDSSLFDGLTSLVKLNLTGNQILNIDDFTFKPLSNLAILDLSLNHIVALRRNAFIGLDSLIQLNLASNYIQSLEEGVFDTIISKVRKIRLQNNQLVCDCNLAWLIRAKDLYNKNMIGKVMCSPSHHQPRVKLSSVQAENLVCANEVHLNHFEINIKNNVTVKESGQAFEFDCKAIDGKQFQSIRFYRNDRLVAESTNYVNYLSDQFVNTTSLLGSRDLIEFSKSVISLNNFTKNSVEQRMIIHRLALSDSGRYECLVQTAFGNLSRRFELKVLPTNATVYQQLIDLIKVPNSIMWFNSFLLVLAILIYLISYGSIEMNSRLKYIQLHLWLQLLALINLFHYSSTDHFSTRLNCELYGLLIYYLAVSILFTTLLASIYLYKQLTKCTTTSLGTKTSSLDKHKRNLATNFAAFTEPRANPHLAAAAAANHSAGSSPMDHQQYSPPAQFNLNPHFNDELISEQILMYQRPARQPKSYCLQFVRFLFHHYTARYHALHTSLTTLVVLVFGLFNLNQFRTDSRCFANILLVSNFYIFVPLLGLIIGQFAMLLVVRCAIKRFHVLHKKLEQRDTVCVSLKAEHVLAEQHSTHVASCLPCFRASSKLDMYWSSSAHFVAQLINFIFYLLLLVLIILTVVDQDTSIFSRNERDDLGSIFSPNTYWWLPSSPQAVNLPTSKSSSSVTNNQTDPLRSADRLNQTLESVSMKASTKTGGLFGDLMPALYLVCSFLLCGHILVHYCFARKDVREALKSLLVKTFCLYACDCCFQRRRCCNTQNQTNTHQPIRPDRYVNCTLVPGILNPNLDAQSSLLNFDQHSQSQKSSSYAYQQYAGYPGSKQQPLLFEEKDEDDLYEQTDNDGQNVTSQLTTLDGLDLIQGSNGNSANGMLYRMANEASRNAFKTMTAYQDGSVTVRLLNDQMLSSESNSTTVTTGGSTASNNNYMCEQPLTNSFGNNGLIRNEMVRQKATVPFGPFRQTTNKRNHMQQQKYTADFKASAFDDTFLEGDGSYLQTAGEKAKSDIVVMNRARKLRKSSMNNKQKPRCIEVKYHQQQGGHLIPLGTEDSSFAFGNLNGVQMVGGQMAGGHQLRTNLPVPSAKSQITTKFEREFLSNQLKKYGSDNLDKLDYLPPVAKKIACKSEVMTTMSQPVTFLGNLGNNSKVHCRPGRHALLQKAALSTGQQTKELNFSNLSSSYNSNFNNSPKAPNLRKPQNRATTLNKSFLPTIQPGGALYKPLLVCGPNLGERIDERFNDELAEQQHLAGDRVKENLYERIPCKKYPAEEAHRPSRAVDHRQDSEDERYDNLDDCLANLNSNRLFLPGKQTNNKGYANLPKPDELSELRSSPVLNLSNLTNLSELRNSSRNSPNFRTPTNLTNRSIQSNNSNRSVRSNQSNNSKKSSIASAHLAGSTGYPAEYNEQRADLSDKLNFSRSSTATSKASDDAYPFTDTHSFNNSTVSSSLNYSNGKRSDQFNLILSRNEHGQMTNRLVENRDFDLPCE